MEVTGGQNLKTLLTRYLELGNLDKVHTWHGYTLWSKEETLRFWWRPKVMGGHEGSNSENIVNMISQVRKIG